MSSEMISMQISSELSRRGSVLNVGGTLNRLGAQVDKNQKRGEAHLSAQIILEEVYFVLLLSPWTWNSRFFFQCELIPVTSGRFQAFHCEG
jgi:hypothetical protein